MSRGGVVLAGGGSLRMGAAKAWLDWHGVPLLAHVARVVQDGCEGPVVVVRAAGQELPPLPAGVRVVEDARPGRGPLEGLAAGLHALRGEADVAYASSTDVPLLQPVFVRRVLAALRDGDDAAVPRTHGHRQPLAAAYRIAVVDVLDGLLARDALKLGQLLDHCRTRFLDEAELLADRRLAAADPQLRSLANVNDPASYRAALE